MPNSPIYELRRGLLTVRVFRRRTREGERHSITVSRRFRDGDCWKESRRFGRSDIPLLRLLLDDVHTWILTNHESSTAVRRP